MAGAGLAAPGDLTSTLLARGSAGEFRIHDRSMRFDARAKEPTDVAVVRATLAPGGEIGWHAHPGPSLLVVQSGELTLIEPHRRGCRERTFGAGEASVHPEDAHDIVNPSPTEPVEFYVTYFVPAGAAPLLTGEPGPRRCS